MPRASADPGPVGSPPSLVRIFLIGYRGTGKTTVAQLVAEALGWRWADMDDRIEASAGRCIRQIFVEEGQEGFRRRESQVLQEMCGLERHVIATGGGVILDPANRELLRRSGLVVWLTADADTLHARVSGDTATAERRPALTVGGRAEIEQLLAVREALYRATAHAEAAAAGCSPEEVATEVLRIAAGRVRAGEP